MDIPKFNLTYCDLPEILHAKAEVAKLLDPQYIWVNDELATQIGIGKDWLNSTQGLDFLTGNLDDLPYEPLAMAYSGHQFGHLSPQLGDGRALLIGEYIASDKTRYDIGLKGSGRTKYSRGGDGKSTLRAALKEVLFSEYLSAVGIPTSRSLAVYSSGETIMRDVPHQGAILARMAKSFIRVGTFQFAQLTGQPEVVKQLADFIMTREFKQIDQESDEKYQILFGQIVKRQAHLIAKWMSHGFIHGVMNTDNMAISGETIDFGPCAFMEVFKVNQVFSSIDKNGRYAWNKQADIGIWNLARLAETFLPLFDDDENTAISIAEKLLNEFSTHFSQDFSQMMTAKLGLSLKAEEAQEMMNLTFGMLSTCELDFTLFFRRLADILANENLQPILDLCTNPNQFLEWLPIWQKHIDAENKSKTTIANNMNEINPIYIPRLDRVEQALDDAGRGDMAMFNRLYAALQIPFAENQQFAEFLLPSKGQNTKQTFCET